MFNVAVNPKLCTAAKLSALNVNTVKIVIGKVSISKSSVHFSAKRSEKAGYSIPINKDARVPSRIPIEVPRWRSNEFMMLSNGKHKIQNKKLTFKHAKNVAYLTNGITRKHTVLTNIHIKKIVTVNILSPDF